MVRSKIAFQQSPDENVLALLQVMGGLPGVTGREFTVTEYADENDLLQAIVLIRLDDDTTVELISRILLAAASVPQEQPWLSLMAGHASYGVLGLRMPESRPVGFVDSETLFEGVDMNIALEQTPVPLCLVEGPEQRYAFLNEAYLRLTGRKSKDQLLGKTLREVFTEEEGRPFFDLVDHVYETGETYVGRELQVSLYSDKLQRFEDRYVDFVYHPVRDRNGKVSGMLTQAADVTERVLDKHVREAREKQLYQQWAELDALYQTSPMGMMLLRAKDLSIQRLNDIQASYLGAKADDLVGKRIEDFYPREPFVGEVLRRVVRDKSACTLEVAAPTPSTPDKVRKWTWNVNPILNAVGEVESIASVALEMTIPPSDPDGFLKPKAECADK